PSPFPPRGLSPPECQAAGSLRRSLRPGCRRIDPLPAGATRMSAFQHRQSAHCETGVMANLLTHAGLPMSEPMAFGLGSGLAFAYLPIVKLGGMPLIAYRMPPRHIIKTLSKRLGARLHTATFNDQAQGRLALD